MTLPIVQPVDGPDWSTTPAFTTQPFGVDPVTAPNQILFEQQLGYYAYAVLRLEGDGDGSDWAVTIQQLTAPGVEGGSVIFEQTTVRIFQIPTVVPMSVIGQSLRLIDQSASTYPHAMGGTLTLYSAFPFQTGFPGGTWVINSQQTIVANASAFFLPLGCAPGPHAITVSTQSPAWDLLVRVWSDATTFVDYLLALGVNGSLIALPFTPPASAWELLIGNNDLVSDWPFAVLVCRDP